MGLCRYSNWYLFAKRDVEHAGMVFEKRKQSELKVTVSWDYVNWLCYISTHCRRIPRSFREHILPFHPSHTLIPDLTGAMPLNQNSIESIRLSIGAYLRKASIHRSWIPYKIMWILKDHVRYCLILQYFVMNTA